MKVLFFNSGDGGNFKFIHKISLSEKNFAEKKIEVVGVIADRECGAIEYAKKHNIPTHIHSFKRNNSHDEQLINIINPLSPDLIVTNVHKIISEKILDTFKDQLINLHYSILPSFQGYIGMKSVEEALKSGCKFVGATCHLVTKDLDGGPIIGQSIFPVTTDNESFIFDDIFKSGGLTLASSIMNWGNNYSLPPQKFGAIITNPGISINYEILNKIFVELKSE